MYACTLYDNINLDVMELYHRAYPQTTPVVSGAVVDEALLGVTDEIVEKIIQIEDAPQTTGSANPYDRVLVELSNTHSSIATIGETDPADDLTTAVEKGNVPLVPQAAENTEGKEEINTLVTEGKSNSTTRGLNLSLETELEPELV